MLIELVLALMMGIIAGTFTGLTPGIHINLIAAIILSLTGVFPPTAFLIFIVAMSVTHTFLDFIPSIFLGAPDEDTALGVLPGHEFLLKGQGHEAVLLTVIGSSISIILLILITPLFILAIPKVFPFIQRMMGFILIWISFFLVYNEKDTKLLSLIIFLLAGFLGISSMNLSSNSLLPSLTGLFGSSTLIYSIQQKTIVPKQKIGKLILNKKELIRPAIATTLVSPIFSFLPGLGSSQAAIVSSQIIKQSKKQFLILLGSINTFVVSVSFLSLYLINKSRTGVASAIQQTMTITPKDLALVYIAIIISAIISVFLTIKISKIFARNIHKINYSKISLAVLILLTIVIILFSGFYGFLIFVVSTLLGLSCTYLGVRKGFLTGSLLIPTILFYLPFV